MTKTPVGFAIRRAGMVAIVSAMVEKEVSGQSEDRKVETESAVTV